MQQRFKVIKSLEIPYVHLRKRISYVYLFENDSLEIKHY